MATKTAQDSYIDSEIRKLNAALDAAGRIALEGKLNRRKYQGAVNEQIFYRICEFVLKETNKITDFRQNL